MSAIVARADWDERALEGLRVLVDACGQADGRVSPVWWDLLRVRDGAEAWDFVAEQHGALTGWTSLWRGTETACDLICLVHPAARRQGLGRRLVAAAGEAARARGVRAFNMACEREAPAGRGFAEALGARYVESEYLMEWDGQFAEAPATGPTLVRTTASEPLVLQYVRCFGDDPGEARAHVATILADPARAIYLASLDGAPIGVITVRSGADAHHIVGFGVLPELRGRGYGRQILRLALASVPPSTGLPVRIEVATDNANALGLYRSCGFRETAVYETYSIEVV